MELSTEQHDRYVTMMQPLADLNTELDRYRSVSTQIDRADLCSVVRAKDTLDHVSGTPMPREVIEGAARTMILEGLTRDDPRPIAGLVGDEQLDGLATLQGISRRVDELLVRRFEISESLRRNTEPFVLEMVGYMVERGEIDLDPRSLAASRAACQSNFRAAMGYFSKMSFDPAAREAAWAILRQAENA